jgi:hypothetical protein
LALSEIAVAGARKATRWGGSVGAAGAGVFGSGGGVSTPGRALAPGEGELLGVGVGTGVGGGVGGSVGGGTAVPGAGVE